MQKLIRRKLQIKRLHIVQSGPKFRLIPKVKIRTKGETKRNFWPNFLAHPVFREKKVARNSGWEYLLTKSWIYKLVRR
jgi:hypothetical protein